MMINDDWEHEFAKGMLYLQEDIEELKSQIYPLLHEGSTTIVVEENEISKRLKHETKLRTLSSERTTEELFDS